MTEHPTDAMIEAGYCQAVSYPAVALYASHNETRSMVETVYLAMNAARVVPKTPANLGQPSTPIDDEGLRPQLKKMQKIIDVMARAIDEADSIIELNCGSDTPKSWHQAFRRVQNARSDSNV